jgi:hypothetical protein
MSWFSDLFNDSTPSQTGSLAPRVPTPTVDPNAEAEALRKKAEAEDAARQAAADEAARQQSLANQNASLKERGVGNARAYFQSMGLDPGKYISPIDARISEIMATGDLNNPGYASQFDKIGSDVYNKLQDQERQANAAAVNRVFAPGFESSRISATTDDPYIENLISGERGKADAVIQNMLKRGVITDTGVSAAEKGLDEQLPGIRSTLNTLGDTLLGQGRQSLLGEAGKARVAADTSPLGGGFDINKYAGSADQAYNDFLKRLPDTLKASTGSGLFDTSGLGAVAGAGMFPQNTKFDPNALKGIIPPDQLSATGANPLGDETTDKRKVSVF